VDNPLVQPDPGLFIWTILTFLVLLALLAKFAWRPLLQALEARQKTIAAALDDARQAREDLERTQQDSARLLAEARREADALIGRARADADRFREELKQQAAAQAAAIVSNAERQVQQETARAMAQFRQEAVDLSFAIASKILDRTVTPQDHERLVDQVVTELDRRPS
jgi:F-type H+-transporting ATPase subunit b